MVPLTVVTVGMASVVLSVGWHDGEWKGSYPSAYRSAPSWPISLAWSRRSSIWSPTTFLFPILFYLWAWPLWFQSGDLRGFFCR
jgi:hypothetical protein